MATPLRKDDMEAARAALAAHEARCSALMGTGQRLLARIRASSKYFGQGEEGALFPIVVGSSGEFGIIGGPGGQYRLQDVDLFVVFADDAPPIQITFEK
jgi:hypothetical protein